MKRFWSKLLLGFSALMMLVLVAAWLYLNSLANAAGPLNETKLFYIEPGSSLSEIAKNAEGQGLVKAAWQFKWIARLKRADRALYAGEYEAPANATISQILSIVASQKRFQRKLSVPEGLSVIQIEALLKASEGLDMQGYERPKEGALLPETYFYERGDSVQKLINRMQQAMQSTLMQVWNLNSVSAPVDTPEDALILASIIEKETALAAERPLVAAVFANRLKQGMRLQSDPTVVYGLTQGLPLGRGITRADLRSETDFNTYRVKGLPPEPIANPGRASIEAAINPANVGYLYFVADGTGGHAFAETLDEHNRNVAHWRKIEKSILEAKNTEE